VTEDVAPHNRKETEHEKERKIREREIPEGAEERNAENKDTEIIISSPMDVDPKNHLKWQNVWDPGMALA